MEKKHHRSIIEPRVLRHFHDKHVTLDRHFQFCIKNTWKIAESQQSSAVYCLLILSFVFLRHINFQCSKLNGDSKSMIFYHSLLSFSDSGHFLITKETELKTV